MMLTVLVTIVPLLTGATDSMYELTLRSEARVRSTYPGDTTTGGAVGDLELNPTGAVLLTADQYKLSLAYSPMLRMKEFYEGRDPELYHSLRLAAERKPGHATRFFANQNFGYGRTDIASLQDPTNP